MQQPQMGDTVRPSLEERREPPSTLSTGQNAVISVISPTEEPTYSPIPSSGDSQGTVCSGDPDGGELEKRSTHTEPVSIVTPKRPQMIVIMVGLCMSLFLAYIDITIVATAVSEIGIGLGDFSQVSWIALAYLLTFTPLQPLYGRFSDIFGRVPMIVLALIMFIVGCAICGAATSMIMLNIARGVAGVGAAGLISLPMIVIADLVPLHRRALYLGIFGCMFALASVLGPVLGGIFTDYVNWRWVFFFNVPVAGVTLILVLIFLRIPHQTGSFWAKLVRVDFPGVITLMGTIVFLLLATVWGGSVHPWNSPIIISFYCLFAVCFASFILIELRFAVEPIIPLRLFLYRNFALSNICILFIGMIILGSVFYLPIFYTLVRGDSATMAGVKLLPLLLSTVFSALIGGIITSKTGRYRPLVWLGTAISVVGLGLLTLLEADTTQAKEIGFLVILGFGCGLCLQTLMLVAQCAVPVSEVAVATSCFSFFQTIGSGIGIAAMSAILNNNLAYLLAQIPGINVHEAITNPTLILNSNMSPEILAQVQVAYVAAIRQIFIVLTPVAGVAFLVSLALRHIPLREDLLAMPSG
ncbi:hypothetical protein IWQ61_005635 [Dispira simplex]|nr:hypothetical protein IWQ61_005635 [Dispira simplex]